jgi:hypothetical protein
VACRCPGRIRADHAFGGEQADPVAAVEHADAGRTIVDDRDDRVVVRISASPSSAQGRRTACMDALRG